MKHIIILLLGIITSSSIFAQQSYETKADSIIRLMSLDEKIGQLNQITGFQMATGPITDSGDKRKLIKEGKIGSMLNVCGEYATRSMQELAMQSRLHIPLVSCCIQTGSWKFSARFHRHLWSLLPRDI